MKLLSFGDCIKNGNYNLHSHFSKVYNYAKNNQIISFAIPEIGNGPNNIIFEKLPSQIYHSIKINTDSILIGSEKILIETKIYSQLSPDHIIKDKHILWQRIESIIEDFSDRFSPKSLIFLLLPENEQFFTTSFEKAFVSYAKTSLSNISLENLPEIIKKMKGTGFGLTPSGDDFNVGVLYALNYFQKIISDDLSKIIDECYKNSLGENIFSNTFLQFACYDRYYEYFQSLLKSIFAGKNKNISKYLNKILSSGNTSGSDMLTGFIVSLKGVLYDQKFN